MALAFFNANALRAFTSGLPNAKFQMYDRFSIKAQNPPTPGFVKA